MKQMGWRGQASLKTPGAINHQENIAEGDHAGGKIEL
jgi:hypothetical protein